MGTTEITPFENTLCIVTMNGSLLRELFENIAAVHGEGLLLIFLKTGISNRTTMQFLPLGYYIFCRYKHLFSVVQIHQLHVSSVSCILSEELVL